MNPWIYFAIGAFLGTFGGFGMCAILSVNNEPARDNDTPWTSWHGGRFGTAPMSLTGSRVEVTFRDGTRTQSAADTLSWVQLNGPDDIVAFRLLPAGELRVYG